MRFDHGHMRQMHETLVMFKVEDDPPPVRERECGIYILYIDVMID